LISALYFLQTEETLSSIRAREFVQQVSKSYCLKEDSSLWSLLVSFSVKKKILWWYPNYKIHQW